MEGHAVAPGMYWAVVASCIQAASWFVAAVGGVVVAYKAVAEMRQAVAERAARREQEAAELRWRRAEKCYQIINALYASKEIRRALEMFDINGTLFPVPVAEEEPPAHVAVWHRELPQLLRTNSTSFTEVEFQIRACFDELFLELDLLNNLVRTELVVERDLLPPLEYYVACISRFHGPVSDYCNAYGFPGAVEFIKRYG